MRSEYRNMNITFLIGNGFDLRLGMKTRFADMYEEYIATPSKSDAIKEYKEMLKNDAPKYETWGDFEMAMAQAAKEFEDETAFIECLRDFKVYMAAYLEREQADFDKRMSVSFNARTLCINETWESIHNFYTGLIPNVINEFMALGVQDNPHYSFISFNYTDVFDSLLYSSHEIIHIHGKLDADVVLGADNIGQVADLPYETTKRFARAFIKPEFNKSFDNARLIKAERAIDNSDIICIYGMSLGRSDYSWIIRLKNWLLSDQGHHLVYFMHDEAEYNRLNWDAIIDTEEDQIVTLLEKLCASSDEMNKVFNQIHIPVGYDMFYVDEILKSEKSKVDEKRKKNEELLDRLQDRPQENLATLR